MSSLVRSNKGDQWYLRGEGINLRPGMAIEVMIGDKWIRTTVKFSRTTHDYVSETRGIYFFDGMRARVPEKN